VRLSLRPQTSLKIRHALVKPVCEKVPGILVREGDDGEVLRPAWIGTIVYSAQLAPEPRIDEVKHAVARLTEPG
jgi:hypothetical protein